jgi:1,2-phenylacetyl-CoA epoxidase catalytic subunit
MAMESDAVRAVEMFQFHRGHLSPQQHDKLREAWRKAMNAAMGEIGLFLPEREVTP